MSTLGTTNVRYATDYNLKSLNLITSLQGGIIDLMPMMIELNLFEDLYSSTISGEIVVQDALGIISAFNLNGNEFLQVQLQKTTSDNYYYSRNFRVYKVGRRVTGDSNQYEVFTLMFCSEEFMLSEQYRISKSFKGQQISTIVGRIMNDYLKVGTGSTKPVYIEPTKGNYDFILPNKKIFETINWLATYSQTKNSVGDMVFFESVNGYYFVSLTSLFKGQVYANYKFDPKNITTDMNQQVLNVSDFEVLNFYDTLAATKNGTFTNKIITLNVLQRKKDSSNGIFDYSNYLTNETTLNPNPVINNYRNRFGATLYDIPPVNIPGLESGCLRMAIGNKEDKKNPGIISRNAVDSVANDIMIEKYLPNRVGQMALANYTRIKVTIPGDPNISVGKVINFSTYKIEPKTYSQGGSNAQREVDPFYSGKYIVTAVRHIVKNNSYITVIEMCKDSNTGKLSGFPYGSSVVKNFVNGVQV